MIAATFRNAGYDLIESLDEGEVGEERATVHEETRTERRRPISMHRAVERGARARASARSG